MTNVDEVVQQANDASSGGTVYRSDDANSTRPFQDYEDVYQFDLAGNRISKTTDLNSATAAVDQIFTYGFDANDRLQSEHSDLNADGVIDLIAQFDYGNDNTSTQQTSRRVTNAEGSQHSITTNIYDLQGRLASSVHENFESNGTTVNYRESTSFDYDHTGIRVASNNRLERLRPGSATMEVMHDARTDYLVEHHNFTGYAQVLREILTDNITGGTRREVLYTLGLDVIRQWSQGGDFAQNYAAWQAYDSSEGGGESNAYLANIYRPTGYVLYMYDGFGSVRALLNVNQYTHARNGEFNVEGFADPQFVRTFTYDAYGQAIGFNPHFAGTTIQSRGEQFDARIGAGYNRARYIDQSTGTWLTLDPFAGNMQDPQSLHKYVYVHGDPIQGVDPTGMFFGGVVGLLASTAIGGGIQSEASREYFAAYLDISANLRPEDELLRFAQKIKSIAQATSLFAGALGVATMALKNVSPSFFAKLTNPITLISNGVRTSRQFLLQTVDTVLRSQLSRLKALTGDKDAYFGIRGSFVKVKTRKGTDFDPNNYDIDAMIVSDKLAAVTPGIIGPDGVPMRFVRDTHPLVGLMQQEVRQRLKSMPEFAGMTKDGDGSFTFRVWTADEVAKKLAKKDEQVHIFE